MTSTEKLRAEVSRRLRVTARELGYRTQAQLAEWLDANQPQVQAWYSGLALPPVKYMNRFAVEHHVTLDWIYRGDGSALSYPLYIRLTAAMDADAPPPPEVPPEPESAAEPANSSYPARKRQAPISQEKRTRATAA